MPDEKKTYLINIESNLKKYAEEAAEAKKKVDELKAANDALKQSGTATTAEIEANNAALRNAQKEYNQAKKMVDLQTAANKSEAGSRKQLGEILKLQEQELGKLGKAYIVNAQGVRTLNPLYVEQRKRIAETKQAIIDYDQSLNDGRSNIGRYGESVKAAFSQAGKSILSMVSPMALITAGLALAKKVFEGFKEAIMSTSGAMNAMNIVGQITKQMFYDVAVNGKLSAESMMVAAEAAKLMNEKRIGDRKDMVEFALLEREIAKLEFDAADKTKTRAERQESLNLAIAKQNELSDKKIIDAKEDLKITQVLIALRPKDDKLRQQEAETITKIIKLDQERFDQSKRNEAKLTGFVQEEIDARKKLFEDYYKWLDKENERKDKSEKERKEKLDRIKKEYDDIFEYAINEMQKEIDIKWKFDEEYGKKLFNQNKQRAKEEWDLILENEKKELEELEKKEELKADIINSIQRGIELGANAIFESKRNRLQAEMEGELSNVNMTEGQKNEIRIKYAKEQQKADISQAIINGALAIGNALATTKPFMPAAIIAASVAAIATIAQIAVIKSQTFKSAGGSTAPTTISTSIPAQKTFAAPTGSTLLTQPQLSQQQLNALPQANLLTAEDIAQALSRMPPPVVTVEDINAKTEQVRKVEVRGNI
jgi:hypothetical protein